MKNKFVSLLLAFIFIFSCLAFASCAKDEEIANEIKYSIYEKDGADMVSFYMTSESESKGKWEYSIDGCDNLETFHTTESDAEFKNGTANYKTLILKAVSEGDDEIIFKLGGEEQKYSVNVAKDESGVLRIKIFESAE